MDKIIVLSALIHFALFLIVHVALLRRFKRESTAKPILLSIFLTIASDVLFWGYYSTAVLFPNDCSLFFLIAAGFLSVILLALLIFHYIAWVFGMGEAAIRIRLLHELIQTPSGAITLDELYQRYNASKIFEARLARLLNSGHVSFDGKYYRVGNRILLIQLSITRILKCFLGLTVKGMG